MDPPREGSTPQFIESVARMAPKRVVYVSCNPVTLARDLELLTRKGYKVESSTPVDMFTTVYIGNDATQNLRGRMVTPRGYHGV